MQTSQIRYRSAKRMALWIARLSCALCLVGNAAAATDSALKDSWERDAPANLPGCSPVERSLIVPVRKEHRALAIGMLTTVEAVKVNSKKRTSLGLSNLRSAPELIRQEIERLEKRRFEVLVLRQGNAAWSRLDDEELDRLKMYLSDPDLPKLRPYLVRAIAKFEGTGAFFAAECDDSVQVAHGSLGHSTPPSSRLPVVIFLKKKPNNVYLSWAMAE